MALCTVWALSVSNEHKAGLSVSALIEDTQTETTMVMANCWYSNPVMPAIPATGINTATNTSVVAITGAVTLFIASR
jgi:hypothetical protein